MIVLVSRDIGGILHQHACNERSDSSSIDEYMIVECLSYWFGIYSLFLGQVLRYKRTISRQCSYFIKHLSIMY